MRIFFSLFGAGLIALLAVPLQADNKVIVHEWGTFTCLQDEQGKAIGGINVDDEPVPPFVFQENGGQGIAAQYSHDLRNFGLPPYLAGKGWAAGDPAVTMRLETPVIYIYPPKGKAAASVSPLDVQVWFHGGYLSQYYPYAETGIAMLFSWIGKPGEPVPSWFKMEATTSSLDWKGVRLGSKEKPIDTSDKVWTTPREVSAPLLQVKFSGHGFVQTERFLFYRGVGHLDSPISLNQASLDVKQREDIFPWIHRTFTTSSSTRTLASASVASQAWLAEIRPDGDCRWEALPVELGPSGVKLAGKFVTLDFRPDNLTKLKTSMQIALVQAGLYPDEASAMLRTWELSYFKSPGLRFFYIVPRSWVDKVLPLKITGAPTEITRVMVGRIELITDEERAALARLAAGPCPDLAAVKKAAQDALENSKLPKDEVDAFYRGEKPLSELGITIPPLIQDYLSLGRFRDALIVREQQQHPSAALAQFIKDNRLASGN